MTVASRVQYAKNKLIDLGWKPWQADGIIGNLMQESAFADDVLSGRRKGDKGTAGFLGQWRDDRLRGLYRFAGTTNPSFDQQIEYVDHELKTNERGVGQRLANAQDVRQATAAMIGYERPKGWRPDSPESGHGWNNRLAYAMASAQGNLKSPANNKLVGYAGPATLADVEPRYRETERQYTMAQRSLPSMGQATIIGGMSNEPMYSPAPRLSNGVEEGDVGDILDVPNAGVPTIVPSSVAVKAPGLQPVEPTTLKPVTPELASAVQPNLAQRAGNAPIQGSASTDQLAGDESDDDLLDGIIQGIRNPQSSEPGTVDDNDSALDEIVRTTREGPAPQQDISLDAVAPDPRQEVPQDITTGFYNLVDRGTLGLGKYSQALGEGARQFFAGEEVLPYSENLDRVSRSYERYRSENPLFDLAANIVGPIPVTMGGLGLASKGLSMASGAIASALPKTEATLNTLGRFFTGASGEFGKGAGQTALRTASKVATSATEGAAAAAIQSPNFPDTPLSEQMATGAAVGSVLGAAGTGIQKLVHSPTISSMQEGAMDSIAKAKRLYRNQDAVPDPGAAAVDRVTRDTNERLFSGDHNTRKLEAMTEESMRSMGATEKTATVANLEKNSNRISNDYKSILSQADARVDRQMIQEWHQWWKDFRSNAAMTPAMRQVEKAAQEIRRQFIKNGGKIDGNMFQDLVRSKSVLGKVLRGKDERASSFAEGLQDMLNGAVERSLNASSRVPGATTLIVMPDGSTGTAIDLFRKANKQWRNLKIVSDAVDKGEGGTSGILDPKALKAAAEAKFRGGRSDDPNDLMQTLADNAQYMPKITPAGSSDEANVIERIKSNVIAHAPTAAGLAALGSTIGYSTGGMTGAIAGSLSGLMAGKLRDIPLRRIMQNPEYYNYLTGKPGAASKLAGSRGAGRFGVTVAVPFAQKFQGR